MKKDEERLEAIPIQRIVERLHGTTVGWVYLWNTGEETRLWLGPELEDVIYEPFSKDAQAFED